MKFNLSKEISKVERIRGFIREPTLEKYEEQNTVNSKAIKLVKEKL